MKRIIRLLLWGAALLLLLAVGLGAYTYTVGTRTLLERAEALALRRMVVPQVDDQGEYRFFFVTNRTGAASEEPVEEQFSAERDADLVYGAFDTAIEPTLGLGRIIDPSQWFLNEEIQLSDVRRLSRDAFVDELGQQVTASPRRSLLVVVHGFRERFPSALRKTGFLGHILDIDTPIVVFDWPGNQGSSLQGYRRARRVAEASGAELAATLRLLISEVQPERLWLIANSMGAEVVVQAFDQLYQDQDLADPETEIEEVVLTAPDVDREKFNQQFKAQILALASKATVYVSSNDRALLASRLINRGRRLGESTIDPTNPDQLAEAAQVAGLLDPGSDRLALVDVTAVNRTRNFHNFSLETPEFFDDLFLRLISTDMPQTRELYRIETPEGTSYHVLTQGR